MNASGLPITQLGSTIKAHLSTAEKYMGKSEEHFKSAGLHLIEAKRRIAAGEYKGNFGKFLALECNSLSSSRAYELIAIANGTKTVTSIREGKAASMKRSRDAVRHVVDNEPEPQAHQDQEEKGRDWHLVGLALLDVAQRNPDPVEFHKWLDTNGFSGMSDDQRVGTMFVAKRRAALGELTLGLRNGETAGAAYMKFLEDMFEDPLTSTHNSDITSSADFLLGGYARTHGVGREELRVAAEVSMGPKRAAHKKTLERLTKKMSSDGMDKSEIRALLHQAMTEAK
jgi:hypothetical protein